MDKVPKHFYVIFNPGYSKNIKDCFKNTQAHEFYNELHLRLTKQEKKPYLYWGKIKKSEKKNPINVKEFREIISLNKTKGVNTHLYISDFNYFWIAKVEDIISGDTPNSDFYENTLSYYNNEAVEVWFKITDMTLIARSPAETQQFISQLYIGKLNEEFFLNPYISNLQYPLVVQDSFHENSLFDQTYPLATQSLIEDESFHQKIEKIIYNYCSSERNGINDFSTLGLPVQELIIQAEMDFYEKGLSKRDDIFFKYYKAFELHLNDIVKTFLLKNDFGHVVKVSHIQKGKSTFVLYDKNGNLEKLERMPIPLKEFHQNFAINDLFYSIFKSGSRISPNCSNKQIFNHIIGFFDLVSDEVIPYFEKLKITEERNEYVHAAKMEDMSDEKFMNFRNSLLGVGQESLLVKMSKSSRIISVKEKIIKKAA